MTVGLDLKTILLHNEQTMKSLISFACFMSFLFSSLAHSTPAPLPKTIQAQEKATFTPVDSRPYFDIPITYNAKVRNWISYFQGDGRKWFQKWLERSYRYLPPMQKQLKAMGLPQDLAYVAMIESGFSPHAVSSADAVGYWQFMAPTANRYGLKTTWWIDERRDFTKSTVAAAKYLGDIYKLFDSWYLTAASYNMGENKMRRLVNRHGTKNFWVLAKKPDFPIETREYIPKLIATMLIAKAPKLYGFYNVKPLEPYKYEYFHVPGGFDLMNLADTTGLDRESLLKLNPELLKGFVPTFIKSHKIRIPAGSMTIVSTYVRRIIE